MSLAVGIQHEGVIYMGADSGMWNNYEDTCARAKIFRWGPLLVGAVGRGRFINLVRTADPPPLPKGGEFDHEYVLVRFVVPHLRGILQEAGALQTDKEDGEESGGNLLVAYRGELAEISEDLGVSISRRPYDATGHPSAVGCAYGALFVSHDSADPIQRLRLAFDAAEEHTDAVRGPYIFFREDEEHPLTLRVA